MKKKLLMLVFAMAAMTAQAQVVLWNGEDKELGKHDGFWNRADPVVIEETTGGNKCLRITLKENGGGWADEHRMAALDLASANLQGLRRISMRIKMSENHNVLVKLTKEGDGGYTGDDTRRWAWYDGEGEWRTLVYEYGAGPNSENIVETGNTLLEIYPYEFENKWGQTIYIDDIQLEGPMVNGSAIRTLADDALTDQQVIVTGSLSKGTYQCTWDGDWHSEAYNDYATLSSKISDKVCFLNLTGAAVADGDGPQLRSKNPNLLILSPTAFYDTDNVITWDAGNSRNNTLKMVLTDANPFYTPIVFHADAVEVTRNLKAGINSLCLPFYTAETEISTNCKIATYKNGTTFTYADHAEANVPFLATAVDAAAVKLNFTNKTVAITPVSLGTTFVGVYIPLGAGAVTGKWGINADGKLQMGGESATISAFHAYLDVPVSAREITIDDGEVTGIVNVNSLLPAEECVAFDLQGRQVAQPTRGLYIVNGKKIVVK